MRAELQLIFSSLAFFWLLILTFLFWKQYSHYRKLTKGVSSGDFKKVLEQHLENLGLVSQKVQELVKRCDSFDLQLPAFIQKFGLVRFNPYKEVGGDQSFSLAFLDKDGNGIVVSALHSRESTRIYAKPVVRAKEAKYQFSEEEKEAIEVAVKSKG
ncbi:MAG: DUF4446 family protein [Patescibacteria group bacterium]|nr:DUF4446 family protein [Patescibacteria group bacterium]